MKRLSLLLLLVACRRPAPAPVADLATPRVVVKPTPPATGLAVKVRNHDAGVLPVSAAWARRDRVNPTVGAYVLLDCDHPPADPCAQKPLGMLDGGLDAEPARLRAACPKARLLRFWFQERGADRVHLAPGPVGAHTSPVSVWLDVTGPEPSEDDEQLYVDSILTIDAVDATALRATVSLASDDDTARIAGRFFAKICE